MVVIIASVVQNVAVSHVNVVQYVIAVLAFAALYATVHHVHVVDLLYAFLHVVHLAGEFVFLHVAHQGESYAIHLVIMNANIRILNI